MTLEIRKSKEGMVIRVKATPNAGNNAIFGVHAGALKIKIAAQPEKGKANSELVGFLSETLGMAKKDIQVIKGETSRNKEVLIKTNDEIKLRRVLNG
jgi:uncharacterized protein